MGLSACNLNTTDTNKARRLNDETASFCIVLNNKDIIHNRYWLEFLVTPFKLDIPYSGQIWRVGWQTKLTHSIPEKSTVSFPKIWSNILVKLRVECQINSIWIIQDKKSGFYTNLTPSTSGKLRGELDQFAPSIQAKLWVDSQTSMWYPHPIFHTNSVCGMLDQSYTRVFWIN